MVRGPFTSRFGVVGSRHFETHGPRPHKVLGSGLISFRESLRVKAKSNGSSRIRIMQNDEEGFDCDCRARVLGGGGRGWRYRPGGKKRTKNEYLPITEGKAPNLRS